MSEAQARKAMDEFKKLAEKHGLWFEVNEKHKPELKDIILTVSVRVTER
jgi:hypothetical protein